MQILDLIDLKDLNDNTSPEEVRCTCCNRRIRHVVVVELDGRRQDLGVSCAYNVAIRLGLIAEEEKAVKVTDHKFKRLRALWLKGVAA